jgi:serine/threonine protein kinase
MIGQTLSHYKVPKKIGEGGMGEVYLAKDTTLDREVAVKVLPATFSEDKERLARLEREARLKPKEAFKPRSKQPPEWRD